MWQIGLAMISLTIVSIVLALSIHDVDCSCTPYTEHIQYDKRQMAANSKIIWIQGITLQTCYRECKGRQHCGSLNFVPKAALCMLYKVTSTAPVDAAGFLYSNKADWDTDPEFDDNTACQSCDNYSVCYPDSAVEADKCVIRECDYPSSLDSGYYKGNMMSVRKKVKYFCNGTARPNGTNVISTCETGTGTWSAIDLICITDGQWSDWGNWADCSVTCGTGQRERTRQCNNTAPSNGGDTCQGDATETETCTDADCPGACQLGWTECNPQKHCYKYLTGLSGTQTAAQAACANEGSSLARVQTYAEHMCIRDLITSGYACVNGVVGASLVTYTDGTTASYPTFFQIVDDGGTFLKILSGNEIVYKTSTCENAICEIEI